MILELSLIHIFLYFGPDKVENDKVDLLNKGDNISKNQHIVKLIEDIYIGCCSCLLYTSSAKLNLNRMNKRADEPVRA